jgi:hypothetical protein
MHGGHECLAVDAFMDVVKILAVVESFLSLRLPYFLVVEVVKVVVIVAVVEVIKIMVAVR